MPKYRIVRVIKGTSIHYEIEQRVWWFRWYWAPIFNKLSSNPLEFKNQLDAEEYLSDLDLTVSRTVVKTF